MYDLTRKIALVTGIGGPVDALGNGKAIAMLLAKQGAIIEGTILTRWQGPIRLRPFAMLGVWHTAVG